MLVEGGYLHSMKLLLEKASATPDVAYERPGRAGGRLLFRKRSGPLVRSLKRLSVILLGWEFQS